MKGPSSLVDLFTVMLSMREHQYALTKDFSKFYQRVDTNEVAQHVRRILWRGCDTTKKQSVYITTPVNFGDKPAGCIAIAALRKTAEQMGKDLPEASWFFMNRTYVDDASGGATTMGRLKKISKELEVIAARGGFEFKETLVSGDPAVDPSAPRKVRGMIWETEADKLQVNMKLNTGGKKMDLS